MSTQNIEAFLNGHGWNRSVAGNDDFDAAVWAVEQMASLGMGIIISGEYGVGKSALAGILARALSGVFAVRLSIADDIRMLERNWQEYNAENPYAANVWIDDLGSESPINEYGIKREPAGDFIVRYHELHDPGTRLIVTTNLKTDELDARYGGRLLSRLKDLCVPLRLNGADKRRWIRRDAAGGAK